MSQFITPAVRARISRIYTLCKPAFPLLRLLCQGLLMYVNWQHTC